MPGAAGDRHGEQDDVGRELLRERHAGVAARRDDGPEAVLAGLHERAQRGVGVVLDDQRDAVAGRDPAAVVVGRRRVLVGRRRRRRAPARRPRGERRRRELGDAPATGAGAAGSTGSV